MLIELMCVSTIPMMKSVITEEKSFMETIWLVYSTRIFTVFFPPRNTTFYVRHIFQLWFPHCRDVCVYFPFPHKNVYGVHVNTFVYSDDVKFYSFFLVLRKRDDCFLNLKIRLKKYTRGSSDYAEWLFTYCFLIKSSNCRRSWGESKPYWNL